MLIREALDEDLAAVTDLRLAFLAEHRRVAWFLLATATYNILRITALDAATA